MPSQQERQRAFSWNRRWHGCVQRFLPLPFLLAGALLLCGCTSSWLGKGNEDGSNKKLDELLTAPASPDLIGDAAIPYGLTFSRVEGVGMVNGLPGAGGPADPSPQREHLLAEMQTHDVIEPEKRLESSDTALVSVAAVMPPGVRRGDPVDLVVRAPENSRVSKLCDGWLMPTRLYEMQVIRNAVRKSDVMVVGVGPILVRGVHEGTEDPQLLREGRLLGRGRSQIDRPLGLVIRPEYQHVLISAQFASAINDRFFFFDGASRRGIAEAREDDFIEIEVHPRYRHNVHRLMAVVRAIAPEKRREPLADRLNRLALKLAEPTTAADAALELEAIGDDAVPTLVDALKHPSPEIRFYAAEALAYLDREEAIAPLEVLARDERAFRFPALAAMEGLQQQATVEALRRLLNEPSNETRYGAFRALRQRRDRDVLVPGQILDRDFGLYQVPCRAEPLVAVSLVRHPEIVVFGGPCPLARGVSFAGEGGVVIRTNAEGQLRVSRFLPGRPDQQTTVPSNVASLCVGITEVGGGYGDCVEALRALKIKGQLNARLAIDPRPEPLRTYYRDDPLDEVGDSVVDDLPPQKINPPPPPEEKFSWSDPFGWWD